ncbi:MAG: dynamin family protein, partial [Candidatus Cloacimonetes bacterium]|nr:dynamin family protein [Candidatus Cloacimonadota bacterium]
MSKLLERAAIICEDLLPIIEKLDDQDAVSYGRLLCQRLHEYQAYVTVIGETSTGKSTLINGLFYRNLLPAKAKPTSGTVVQVKLTEEEKPEFYVVNKDASLDEIDQVIFEKIAELPDENTLRLLAYVNPTDSSFYGLNIFDTPGYNSLIVEHEEALKEFIPNSDLLVFACGYRTGFNQIDQDLFEVVRESIPNKDIPIILAINRVPPGTNISNGRIKEIIHNAEDSLHQKVNTVMVNEVDKKRDPGVRPNTMDLWHQVNTIIQDPSVQEVVDRSLLQLLQGFIDDSISSVDLMISYHSIKREDTVALQKQHSILKQAHLKSVNAVFSCSRRLKSLLPPSIDQAANNIERSIVYDIESSNKWLGKDDTYAWIQGHALPIGMKKEGRIIESLISIELDRLDEELEEIANTAIKEIKRSIQFKADTETEIFEKALKNLLQRSLAKYIGRSLSR